MPATAIFSLTPADLIGKLVPAPGAEDYSFSIGPTGPPDYDLSEADAVALMEEQEAVVASYMRPKYQRMLTRVEGEIAVRFAEPGQTELSATLAPVTWLRVYKNFPRSRAWPDRRPGEALPESAYTLDAATGAITLEEGLRENDRVWLDYRHGGGARLADLRFLVLTLSAVEVARRFSYFRSEEGFDRYERWEATAEERLRDIRQTNGMQIAAFDAIDLVNETQDLDLGSL